MVQVVSFGAERIEDDAVHAAALFEVLARGQVRRLVLLVLLDLGLRESILPLQVPLVENARAELVFGSTGLPFVLLRRIRLPLLPFLYVTRGILEPKVLSRLTLGEIVLAALFEVRLTGGDLRVLVGRLRGKVIRVHHGNIRLIRKTVSLFREASLHLHFE